MVWSTKFFRPWRDDEQRLSGTVTAAAESVRIGRGIVAGQRSGCRATGAGPVSESAGPVEVFVIGLIWWSYQPSESSYRTTTAVLLQVGSVSSSLNGIHDEGLFVERIGVSRVSVFKTGGLEEADRGEDSHPRRRRRSPRYRTGDCGPGLPISEREAGRVCAWLPTEVQ